MLIATAFFWLPSDSNSVSAQEKGKGKNRGGNQGRIWQPPTWQRPIQARGPKDRHGYRNYGQYRRTQVGNRRYSVTRRPFWQNRNRLTRRMRVDY